VDAAIRRLQEVRPSGRPGAPDGVPVPPPAPRPDGADKPPTPVTGLRRREREETEGVITSVRVQPVSNSQVLECELADGAGTVLLRFYGRTHIPGIGPGQRVRVRGMVGRHEGAPAIANPQYELLDGAS
jgi:RecG-like helicase